MASFPVASRTTSADGDLSRAAGERFQDHYHEVTQQSNIYVSVWNRTGRVTKLAKRQ
jgi:hypothetical protein